MSEHESSRPCGCDYGAGWICEWHTKEAIARMAEQKDFVIKDSGERAQFSSGMVRDTTTNKTDFELPLNGPMFDRWAQHLTKGAVKYPDVELGVPNWTLANGREELIRFRKSAMRHFRQWLKGDVDEDHAAAVFFNINGYEYVKARMAAETPRRSEAGEKGCPEHSPHGNWQCERQAGHLGKHMAWDIFPTKFYAGGEW